MNTQNLVGDITILQDKINRGIIGNTVYLMFYLGYDIYGCFVFQKAKTYKEQGKIVVAIIAMPAKWEGIEVTKQASKDFTCLKPFIDTFFIFYRDTFEEDNPDVYKEYSPIQLAINTFKLPLDVVNHIENQKGEIIIDEGDLKTLFKSGSFSAVGMVQSNQSDRIIDMYEQLINSPYLKHMNYQKCTIILLSFVAGEQYPIQMDEIDYCTNLLRNSFNDDVDFIIGLKTDNSLGDMATLYGLFSFSEHALLSMS